MKGAELSDITNLLIQTTILTNFESRLRRREERSYRTVAATATKSSLGEVKITTTIITRLLTIGHNSLLIHNDDHNHDYHNDGCLLIIRDNNLLLHTITTTIITMIIICCCTRRGKARQRQLGMLTERKRSQFTLLKII